MERNSAAPGSSELAAPKAGRLTGTAAPTRQLPQQAGIFGLFCKICFVYSSDTLDGSRSWDFEPVTGVDQELEHAELEAGNF